MQEGTSARARTLHACACACAPLNAPAASNWGWRSWWTHPLGSCKQAGGRAVRAGPCSALRLAMRCASAHLALAALAAPSWTAHAAATRPPARGGEHGAPNQWGPGLHLLPTRACTHAPWRSWRSSACARRASICVRALLRVRWMEAAAAARAWEHWQPLHSFQCLPCCWWCSCTSHGCCPTRSSPGRGPAGQGGLGAAPALPARAAPLLLLRCQLLLPQHGQPAGGQQRGGRSARARMHTRTHARPLAMHRRPWSCRTCGWRTPCCSAWCTRTTTSTGAGARGGARMRGCTPASACTLARRHAHARAHIQERAVLPPAARGGGRAARPARPAAAPPPLRPARHDPALHRTRTPHTPDPLHRPPAARPLPLRPRAGRHAPHTPRARPRGRGVCHAAPARGVRTSIHFLHSL